MTQQHESPDDNQCGNTNAALFIWSVQAALHRSTGNLSAAIEVLRKHLDHFMNDKEAWEELADCYVEVGGCYVYYEELLCLLQRSCYVY